MTEDRPRHNAHANSHPTPGRGQARPGEYTRDAPVAPEAATTATRRIGPYDVQSEIGRGAHGVVYRARHPRRPDRPLALKVVESRASVDRLLVEPEILSKLSHPGIVGIEDYFLHNGDLVIALEFIDGEALDSYLARRGRLGPQEVRAFLAQMAAALDHAHRAGVLHRDIKLSNVLVDGSGQSPRFVLTDFGISRLSEGIQAVRRKGGTYQFMAPEQLRGRPQAQSDLWSLGVVAYVLLAGKPPFQGQTLDELSREILYTVPVPPSQLSETARDDELEQVLYELLEKPLTSRTPSASELLKRLKRPGRAPDAPQPQSADERPPPTTRPTRTYQRRARRRIRWSWILFCITVAFLLGPLGLLAGSVALGGVLIFYAAQSARGRARRWPMTGAAVAVMAAASWLAGRAELPALLRPLHLALVEEKSSLAASMLWLGFVVYYLVFGPLAVHFFTKARRLRRELVLRELLRDSTADPQRYLGCLKSLVELRPEDSYAHHKYVEGLLAQGQTRDAVVEARLMLEEDPYDFGASLLLACAYFDAGRYMQCCAVCDQYLSVSGYCFEFEELKERSTAMLGARR